MTVDIGVIIDHVNNDHGVRLYVNILVSISDAPLHSLKNSVGIINIISTVSIVVWVSHDQKTTIIPENASSTCAAWISFAASIGVQFESARTWFTPPKTFDVNPGFQSFNLYYSIAPLLIVMYFWELTKEQHSDLTDNMIDNAAWKAFDLLVLMTTSGFPKFPTNE